MRLLRPLLAIAVAALACAPQPSMRSEDDEGEPAPEDKTTPRDAATSRKDAKAASTPDVAPAPTPDAAVALDKAPDKAPEPAVDAPPALDQGAPDLPPPAETDGPGGAPVAEATWSHTMCNKAQLMFPKIDKNNGVFPIGSCPPPETLARPCGGDSKLKVMTATASSWETGYYHPPNYAFDEHLMTRWSSNSGATAWLSLDLGSEQTFKRVYLAWEVAHATDYDLVVSNDGTTWMPLKQVRAGDGYQDIVDVDGKGRYLRVNGVKRGPPGTYGYSLFDVTICGERP